MRSTGGLGHARALAGSGAADEAERLLAVLTVGSDSERVELALARARNLFWALGRHADAERVLDGVDAPEIDALRAEFALAQEAPAVAIAAAVRSPQAAVTLAEALAIAGRLNEALAASREPRAAALTYWLAGQLELATLQAEYAYEAAPAVGALRLGQVWLARGEVARSLRWFRESAVLLRAAPPCALRPQALAGLAQAAAQAGDAEHAAAAIAGLHQDFTELALARAWTAHAAGDHAHARWVAETAAHAADARGAHALAERALAELGRLT